MNTIVLGGKNYVLPDISAWERILVEDPYRSVKFSSQDVYVLGVHGKKKEFFTWFEAMELEEAFLRPNGWRLPNLEDWQTAIFKLKYRDGLIETLRLKPNGYLFADDVGKYNERLEESSISFNGTCGCYWSREEASKTNAYYVHLTPSGIPYISSPPGIDFHHKDRGYSLRAALS